MKTYVKVWSEDGKEEVRAFADIRPSFPESLPERAKS